MEKSRKTSDLFEELTRLENLNAKKVNELRKKYNLEIITDNEISPADEILKINQDPVVVFKEERKIDEEADDLDFFETSNISTNNK